MKCLTIAAKSWLLLWLIYWAELLNGIIGIVTFGFLNLDLASKAEHKYLDFEEVIKFKEISESYSKISKNY